MFREDPARPVSQLTFCKGFKGSQRRAAERGRPGPHGLLEVLLVFLPLLCWSVGPVFGSNLCEVSFALHRQEGESSFRQKKAQLQQQEMVNAAELIR